MYLSTYYEKRGYKIVGDKGFVLKVDLTYPEELHDCHSDYPLAPESFKIKPEMLSSYQKEVLSRLK